MPDPGEDRICLVGFNAYWTPVGPGWDEVLLDYLVMAVCCRVGHNILFCHSSNILVVVVLC